MWDHVKTAAPSSLPPPLSPADSKGKTYWRQDFDERLNGLGITNAPYTYKYEIQRGKTVPRPGSIQL